MGVCTLKVAQGAAATASRVPVVLSALPLHCFVNVDPERAVIASISRRTWICTTHASIWYHPRVISLVFRHYMYLQTDGSHQRPRGWLPVSLASPPSLPVSVCFCLLIDGTRWMGLCDCPGLGAPDTGGPVCVCVTACTRDLLLRLPAKYLPRYSIGVLSLHRTILTPPRWCT